MKYLTFLIWMLCIASCGIAQLSNANVDTALNLGFEHLRQGKPVGWYIPDVAGYSIQTDSMVSHDGHNSVCLSFNGDSASFTAVSIKLPHIYKGNTISLSGYIKTENVTGGRAGLWLRIDPQIAFDNMDKTQVVGTTGWKRYEIQLKMNPETSKDIVIGGLLIGKGKMWLDDLEVKIDGKPLSEASVFVGKQYPADKDTAFSRSSGITQVPDNRQALENLKILGLVWGYLKFYHPAVALGEYNWTNELFRLLPKVSAAQNNAIRDAILSDFITGLGPIKKEKVYEKDLDPQSVKLAVDTSWFSSVGLSDKLSAQLRNIYSAERPDSHYYYGFTRGAGNVVFQHERQFSDINSDDVGMRLLALYRYWNAIEYFSPYRYLIDDWQKVLADYIPIMITANDRLKYEQGLTSLIAAIEDSHGNLNGKATATYEYYGGFSPAIGVEFVQNKWVVNRYLDSSRGMATNIKIGDVLEEIDGRPVGEIVKSRLAITPASNKPTRYRNISWALLRTKKDSLTLILNRNGKQIERKVKTFRIGSLPVIMFADKNKSSFTRLQSDIGYIYPGTIRNSEVDDIMRKAADTKGLIIDLRCYPSEFIVFTLGAKLTSRPVKFVKFTSIDHHYPGKVIMEAPLVVGKDNPAAYKGKVVVLVNEYTQSQAEYTTMAFRATGATVIGSTTAGADGNVSGIQLPGSLSTSFSGLGVYYPDGTETQQVGIKPDIYCTPTLQGLKDGKDELLERAIEYIQTGQ